MVVASSQRCKCCHAALRLAIPRSRSPRQVISFAWSLRRSRLIRPIQLGWWRRRLWRTRWALSRGARVPVHTLALVVIMSSALGLAPKDSPKVAAQARLFSGRGALRQLRLMCPGFPQR
jgi:hypothetical protein